MNILRYRLPVLVAAGLHGALLLSSVGEHEGRGTVVHPKPKIIDLITDMTIDPPEPSSDDDARAGGSGKAVTQLPEPVAPLEANPPFTMDVRPEVPFEKTSILPDAGQFPGPGTDLFTVVAPSRPIDATGLDRVPRPIAQNSPNYPANLKQDGVAGTVVVEFVVATDGHVIQATAVRATNPGFVEPALRAVRGWRFESGKRNGKLVSFRMAVPIQFDPSCTTS